MKNILYFLLLIGFGASAQAPVPQLSPYRTPSPKTLHYTVVDESIRALKGLGIPYTPSTTPVIWQLDSVGSNFQMLSNGNIAVSKGGGTGFFTFTQGVTGNQTLSIGNAGALTISGGNTVNSYSLIPTASTNANNLYSSNGMYVVSNTTGSTNYPYATGMAVRFLRTGSSALGYFELGKSSLSTDEVWFRTGSGTSTFNAWDIIAGRDWVTSIYQTLANLSTDLAASATKYPSVNAVNTGLGLKLNTNNPTATGTFTTPNLRVSNYTGGVLYSDAIGNINNVALLPVSLGGTGVSGSTGTGSAFVLSNAPTLVNPIVGTQSSKDSTDKAASTKYVDQAVSVFSSGTYTPTLSNVSNATSFTPYPCQWTRLGNNVVVSGRAAASNIVNTSGAVIGLSLPITSNFTALSDANGAGFSIANGLMGATIYAVPSSSIIQIYGGTDGTISAQDFSFTFTYTIK